MNPSRLRSLVLARDGGVCALCSCDTEAIRIGYEAALAAARERHAAVIRDTAIIGYRVALSAEKLNREIRDIRERLERLGFKPGQALWHCDHIIPLIEGGTNDVDQCRTLCVRCHKVVTAELQQRRGNHPGKRVWIHGQDRHGRARVIQ